MIGNCDSCKHCKTCRKDFGYLCGYCNTDYEPIADKVFTITTFLDKFQVCMMVAGSVPKRYLVSTRNGVDVWKTDFLNGKQYSFKTAKKHVLRLLAENPGSAAILCDEVVRA